VWNGRRRSTIFFLGHITRTNMDFFPWGFFVGVVWHARQKPGEILIFSKRYVTRGKIWQIHLGDLKKQILKKQKFFFFASSFAFFKVAKKLYVYYQISRLRVDIERYFLYLYVYRLGFSIWLKFIDAIWWIKLSLPISVSFFKKTLKFTITACHWSLLSPLMLPESKFEFLQSNSHFLSFMSLHGKNLGDSIQKQN
jgi:hypothetical protein